MSGGSWDPIISGSEAEEVLAVVEEIASRLPAARAGSDPAGGQLADSPSLAGGDAGLALFFGYLDRAFPGAGHDEACLDLLGAAIDGCGREMPAPSLYSGFCGVAWVVQHLAGQVFEAEEDVNADIDEHLAAYLADGSRRFPYELINGLAGFGVYALERRSAASSAEGLILLLFDRLAEAAERGAEGTTWFTPPEEIAHSKLKLAPDGYYDLGVAHGVGGAIGFLAEVCRTGTKREQAANLLTEAVDWLLSRQLAGEDARFPSIVAPGVEPIPARTAWCYGDLGLAVVLLDAARALGRQDWERQALELAHLAARRPIEATQVRDPGLCHGAAGLGHLFNRLHQATGDPICRAAARSWFTRTLAARKPDEGLAGFLSWVRKIDGNGRYEAESGFLTGAAGIGLALLAAVTDVEPLWDRVLLTAIPPELSERSSQTPKGL